MEQFVEGIAVGAHPPGYLFQRHLVHHHCRHSRALALRQRLLHDPPDLLDDQAQAGRLGRVGLRIRQDEGRRAAFRRQILQRDVLPPLAAQLGKGDANRDLLRPGGKAALATKRVEAL